MNIIVAGDYVARNRLAALVAEGKYQAIFGKIKDVVSSADFAILNFESPIINDTDSPIAKCGPNLHSEEASVKAIKYAGFNCVTLANNHIRDYGDEAVRRTISTMKKYGIECVGAGENDKEASSILYLQHNGKTLAIINCCENEFSIANSEHGGANPLNPINQYYAIHEAKQNADYVLVIVHGGHEHHQLPSPRMQDTYRFFVDVGADIVINHHQHCYSGYEIYKNKPIVYGTGNFCMDKDPIRIGQIWNYGYLVKWDSDVPSNIKLIPYNQCGEEPCVCLMEDESFSEKLDELNDIIVNREKLERATEEYYKKSCRQINNLLEPIQNRLIGGLQHRHILPSLITKKWLLKLQDFILCESHRDKVDYYFKSRNK